MQVSELTRTIHTGRPKAAQIVAMAAEFYCTTPDEMKSKRRQTHVVLARWMSWTLMREFTRLSYPQMSRQLEKSDHGAALRAVQRLPEKIKKNKALGGDLDYLRNKIKLLMEQRA